MTRHMIMGQDDRRGFIVAAALAVFLAGYGLLILTGVTNVRHFLDNALSAYLLGWALYGMFARVPLQETGARFLLTTSALICCWILAESATLLRVIDYRALFGSHESGTALSMTGRRFDSELVWRHDPHYQYEAPYHGNIGRALCMPPDPTRTVAVRYDRNGFRNARDLETADVVVIGDSYVEGYLMPDEQMLTTHLSRLQGRSVANLGHSGYGPQQELAVLRRFGLPLNPKTVVWAFFEGNDVSDAETYWNRGSTIPRSGINGWHEVWQDFWFRSLTRNVSTLLLRTNQGCTPDHSLEEYRAEFLDAGRTATTVFFASSEVGPVSVRALHKAVAPILQAAQLCHERGIRFLVAFVPEKFRVYHDLHNVSLATATLRQWHVSDLPVQLQELLEESHPHLEYVDLTSALKAAARDGVPTYLSDDTHWTEAGHRVAAESIHRALQKPPQIMPSRT
ncbi:MAG: hypothetical protein JSR62_10970 [Nitrospira sp.]|nr:hypothetical protein [Nitrospira sp.]